MVMKKCKLLAIAAAAGGAVSLLTAGPAQGAVLLSEVLYNESGSDTGGEFYELYNSGSTAVDLSNWKIGDEETNGATTGAGSGESLHVFPAGSSIAPGAVQVIARNAPQFSSVYGFLPTYELLSTDPAAPAGDPAVPDLPVDMTWDLDGGAAAMANGNDESFIMDASNTLIDAISWGTSVFAFDPALASSELDGQSYRRISETDTNTANDWELSPDTGVSATRSSPGVTAIPEPAALSLAGLAGLGLLRRRVR